MGLMDDGGALVCFTYEYLQLLFCKSVLGSQRFSFGYAALVGLQSMFKTLCWV